MTITEPTAAGQTAPSPVLAQNVGREFQSKIGTVVALEDVSLEVLPGQFVSLIGPSGCGKSTLLRLVADLDSPTSGQLTVFGQPPSKSRKDGAYGIAFQKSGLLPWKSVRENIELPLRLHGNKSDARSRSTELLAAVGLSDFANHFPDQLSGGMQQRVAIARSLAEKPALLLMDEPFGALDEMTREKMQSDLKELCAETGAAVLFVTHSIPEAVFLSDRVVVMSPRPGRIRAVLEIRLRDTGADPREAETYYEAITQVREALHGAESVSGHGMENR